MGHCFSFFVFNYIKKIRLKLQPSNEDGKHGGRERGREKRRRTLETEREKWPELRRRWRRPERRRSWRDNGKKKKKKRAEEF